jgi:predicted DNA-binding protein
MTAIWYHCVVIPVPLAQRRAHVAKYTIQMNDRLEEVLDELAEKDGISKAQVIRKSLTLLKLAEDEKEDGYGLALVKSGEPPREILLTG